jgi:hypothetical protein
VAGIKNPFDFDEVGCCYFECASSFHDIYSTHYDAQLSFGQGTLDLRFIGLDMTKPTAECRSNSPW